MLEGQLNLFGKDDGHRTLLQDPDRAVLGQAVGGQLLALVGIRSEERRGGKEGRSRWSA